MKYLIQWSPFKILGEFDDDVILQPGNGQDVLSSLPDFTTTIVSTEWNFDIVPWEEVIKLHDNGNYREIFTLHNAGRWSSFNYCCNYNKKLVDENIEKWKQMKEH